MTAVSSLRQPTVRRDVAASEEPAEGGFLEDVGDWRIRGWGLNGERGDAGGRGDVEVVGTCIGV